VYKKPLPDSAQTVNPTVKRPIFTLFNFRARDNHFARFSFIYCFLTFATVLHGGASSPLMVMDVAYECYLVDKMTSSPTFNAASHSSAILTNPTITARFANPQYDCVTEQYCVDVELHSDTEGQELFGMNVRFFYDNALLELIDFRDFQGGYGPVAPNPPTVSQSPPGFGTSYFGFASPGVADWVNGGVQLLDLNQPPVYIDTSGWTKIFQICFDVDAPFADSASFCPPIVWDLEADPANGGYLAGDDGVVITVVAPPPGESDPATENVVQFNWEYTGSGSAPPFGQLAETDCFAFADAAIDGSTDQGCYFTNRVFQPVQSELPNVIYNWNFGAGAIPATAIGYGPHEVFYNSSGTKTVSLVITPDPPGAQCPDSASLSFVIVNCPSNIAGTVNSISQTPIAGVNVRLYEDADTNGVADNNIAIRSVFTTSTGVFSMASLTPGNYVLIQTQPAGWNSFDDGDTTDDGDIVYNVDSLDNIIPVSLAPSELDAANYFIESPVAGTINGSVFVDMDNDQNPDAGEGIANAAICLFPDANADGVADTNEAISVQLTTSNGSFSFTEVPVGHYVICEIQPSGYFSIRDVDTSNDNDLVPNTDTYNDTIPVTLINAENDAHNYFIDTDSCNLIVTNSNDEGPGSLRSAIECASAGDTIRFHSSLDGSTITITSQRLVIDKNLVIYSDNDPRVVLASQIEGFFDILANQEIEFIHLDIISGLAGNSGAAFKNEGILKLEDSHILRNPLLIAGAYIIYNFPASQLILSGSCSIDTD
jgi:hypothetical protein